MEKRTRDAGKVSTSRPRSIPPVKRGRMIARNAPPGGFKGKYPRCLLYPPPPYRFSKENRASSFLPSFRTVCMPLIFISSLSSNRFPSWFIVHCPRQHPFHRLFRKSSSVISFLSCSVPSVDLQFD